MNKRKDGWEILLEMERQGHKAWLLHMDMDGKSNFWVLWVVIGEEVHWHGSHASDMRIFPKEHIDKARSHWRNFIDRQYRVTACTNHVLLPPKDLT
jgi:hypothetical protein